jgi:O-antigen ligase
MNIAVNHRPMVTRHRSQMSSVWRQSIHYDIGALILAGICAIPALTILLFGGRTQSAQWLYLSILVVFGYCCLFREYARLSTVIIGLIPLIMLLRNDFYYNLPIALLAASMSIWFFTVPAIVIELWTNIQIRLMLILSASYWLISYWLTGDYSVNLRVMELSFSVCLIFLLANSPRHLYTGLVGIGLTSLAICIALMPHGDRLGMAVIDGQQLGNPISLGTALALMVTLVIADRGRWLGLDKSILGRILCGVTAGVLLLLTTSRGAIAIALVCVLVLLWLGRKQRASVILLLLLLTLAIPLALATPRGIYLEQWFGRTVSTERSLTEISSGRSDQWLLFPRVFMESPLWGSGPGLGRTEYAKYSQSDPRIVYRQGKNADWHAIYLQLGIEAGLIGLIGFGIVVFPILICCFRHWQTTGEVVPMLGAVGFLVVAGTVSAMDAISGVFFGLGVLSTRLSWPVRLGITPSERTVSLTRRKARRYLRRL